ncbi:MAG: hypothetical protein JNK10_03240 [Cyclobacteriaceae bacterium]|nr:hypothetical protein [Cyclobacteriaceae bacterium]
MKNFEKDVVEMIPMPLAIGLMKEAFVQLSLGKAVVPLRSTLVSENGSALFMPSYSPTWGLFGLKMVSVFPDNKAPVTVIQGTMMVMDAKTGTPLATMDAASVTALRTGAASGLATDLLASPDASVLVVFGTGAQAWTQTAAVLAVRPIKRVLVCGTSREKAIKFCDQIKITYKVSSTPLVDPGELKQADVICTATTSKVPLFSLQDLKPGVHINAVGAFRPDMRELGDDIIRHCKLIVDQRDAILHEAGEVAIPVSEGKLSAYCIHAELGEVVDKKKSGRQSTEEITVFKSVGNAIQDLAIARHLIVGHVP